MSNTEPSSRFWRRLARGLATGILLAASLAALAYFAIPAYLNSEANRLRMLGQANTVLAPARLSLDRIRFSWWEPTRLEGFALISKEGKRVVFANKAVWERKLGQILLDRKNLGTLRLPEALLDVARSDDGVVDLQEVLKPILVDDPDRSLRIEVVNSQVRFQGEGSRAPWEATLANLDLRIGPSPNPTTWHLALNQNPSQTLALDGSLDTWQRDANGQIPLDLNLTATQWPLDLGEPDRVKFAAVLEAKIEARRRSGLWKIDCDSRLGALEASGGILGDDRPTLQRVDLIARVKQTLQGWEIANVDLQSDVGRLRCRGRADFQDPGDLEMTATLDLGALAAKLPQTLGRSESIPLEGTSLEVRAESRKGVDSHGVDIEARWSAVDPRRDPAQSKLITESVLKASLNHPSVDRWELLPLSLSTPYGQLHARGSIDRTLPGEDWNYRAEGSIEPDWASLADRLRASVDPKAELVGKPLTFKIEGGAADATKGSMSAEVRVGLERVDVYGLEVGPTEAVFKLRDGKPGVEPIDVIVNQGNIHLEPAIDRVPMTQNWEVRLGKESFVSGVVVNDVVSRRFLAYVAPILEKATRVSGKISARIEEAVIPLSYDEEREPIFRGGIEFEELTFLPGPLADELVALTGRAGQAGIRLNQPVSLTIADRKVVQKGLAIPIGNLSKVSLEGSVDFDKNLDLVATLPLTSEMLGGRPVLGDIIDGTTVEIPIKGTLDKPKIDKEALNLAMKDLGKTLLTKGLMRGASEILTRMITPRDPNAPPAPPRLSAEERKAQRLQKQAERRKRRGLEP